MFHDYIPWDLSWLNRSRNLTTCWSSPKTRRVHRTQELNHACVHRLIALQLRDGGWPFTSGSAQPAVEPTALALLALPSHAVREREAAICFLLHVQNANGSWPAFHSDDRAGSGVTGLALYALDRCGTRGIAGQRALKWILQSKGWESHWLWRWKFRTSDRHVRFDPDKFGWPWMPETASWVVPTAYSLLALRHARRRIRQQDFLDLRIRHGVEMLYDRICPGGGWNAGNGVVYGSPLAPHPDTTATALLALLEEPLNDFVATSLAWLERRAETYFAPWSLAWTVLALDAFGLSAEASANRLSTIVDPRAVTDCATLAVTALAFGCGYGLNVFGVNT